MTTLDIARQLRERILILDGAMGTMIQAANLGETDFAASVFRGWPLAMRGNNDALNLTRPDIIEGIHRAYIDAGADIITTNTFSSNAVSQHDYHCEQYAPAMARAGAQIARRAADNAGRKVWVLGTMGPTSKSLTIANDMAHPESRAIDFPDLEQAYFDQAEALVDGGADMLMLETCFDALNTKAGLHAISRLSEKLGRKVEVMVSATINDRSGRTLTGQTLEAFFTAVSHYGLLSFGLNCSFGVEDLMPFVRQVSEFCPTFVSVHPNAGLPNEMGEYDEMPEYTASHLKRLAEEGCVNIVGGCCGTTPDHIRAIAQAVKGIRPRQVPADDGKLHVSGLETMVVDKATRNFTNIGERTNVAGSRRFARLIREEKFDEALAVARTQIEGGADIIDINMDDAMLDSRQSMRTFLRHIAGEPEVAKAAIMIDSSDWPTIVEGLQNAQGKCIVNSLSLKNGEQEFLQRAAECHRMGAAIVVMAFDEQGQATTYDRKIEICRRAYGLLVGQQGMRPSDIIFDCNVLSVGTGIAEHANYGVDFIRAVHWIKQNLPGALTSGGISNLSFSFRGNNVVREAMHSAFLYHAIREGLDMGIVNPTMLQVYDDIPPQLLKAVEDVILNRTPDATEKLIELAAQLAAPDAARPATGADATAATAAPALPSDRVIHALVKGIGDHLAEDIPLLLDECGGDPVRVIEGPLMQGMERVGQLFGEGKMFLPQVVKSARIMKQAVDILQPYMDKAQSADANAKKTKALMATVKGDVHDIGKNIVDIVLGCNNFDVTDLGVMVPAEKILEETRRLNPLFVGVSGLITPSLKEMENLCRLFESEGMTTPIFVGGATTSAVHTAVKLAPLYSGGVYYGHDASATAVMAKKLATDPDFPRRNREEQEAIRRHHTERTTPLLSFSEANKLAPDLFGPQPQAQPSLAAMPQAPQPAISGLEPLIDWRMLLLFWGFKGESLSQQLLNAEAAKTLSDAKEALHKAQADGTIDVRLALDFHDAHREGNDIVLDNGTRLPMLRSQAVNGQHLCLADFLPTEQQASTMGTTSPLGLFCISAHDLAGYDPKSYDGMMHYALCARLAEATAEWIQSLLPEGTNAIRAAFGYPSCPDRSLMKTVFNELRATERTGAKLTENYFIVPATSICGMMVIHPEARYFAVGRIGNDQLADYASRTGLSADDLRALLGGNAPAPDKLPDDHAGGNADV